MQWITTTCYVSAVSNNSPGRVAALVYRQVSVTLAAIASFASRLYIFSLVETTEKARVFKSVTEILSFNEPDNLTAKCDVI